MDKNGIGLDEITGQGYFPLNTANAIIGVGLNEIPGEVEEQARIQQTKIKTDLSGSLSDNYSN